MGGGGVQEIHTLERCECGGGVRRSRPSPENHMCFRFLAVKRTFQTKIVSEYDQEIPQSQTADNPVAP